MENSLRNFAAKRC